MTGRGALLAMTFGGKCLLFGGLYFRIVVVSLFGWFKTYEKVCGFSRYPVVDGNLANGVR
jgi:hypothetical protein